MSAGRSGCQKVGKLAGLLLPCKRSLQVFDQSRYFTRIGKGGRTGFLGGFLLSSSMTTWMAFSS